MLFSLENTVSREITPVFYNVSSATDLIYLERKNLKVLPKYVPLAFINENKHIAIAGIPAKDILHKSVESIEVFTQTGWLTV